jgi:hypothetical protein
MRAWELTENSDPPSKPITIRALHKLKIEAKAKAQHDQERMAFMPIMYGDADRRREQLELERLELELAQLRADINATNAETATKSAMVIHKNAKSGIDAAEKNQQHLTKLAKSGVGRSLKV